MTDEHRCATCQHWSRYTDDRYVPSGNKQGVCELASVLQGIVMHPASKARAEAVTLTEPLTHVNRFLSTDADFGCTQWARRVATEDEGVR